MRMEWLARCIAVGALLGAPGCQTPNTTAGETLAAGPEKVPAQAAAPAVRSTGSLAGSDLDSVYFDYDRWVLREDARLTLKENARKIQSVGSAELLVIEGHCDERGSEEYNLALGEKRASVVARYLQDLGIPGSRLRTVSFGEARPAAAGHDEAAWRVNRRSEIHVESRTASR